MNIKDWLIRLKVLVGRYENSQEPAKTENLNYLLGYLNSISFIFGKEVPIDEVIKELDKNTITVSHKDLNKQVKDLKFDWVNSDAKNFKATNKAGEKEYRVFHFNKYISSEDAIKEMKKEGFKSADCFDLMAYGKIWNGKDLVIALGSPWQDVSLVSFVLVLSQNDSERRLSLGSWDGGWYDHCRFLGVSA